MSNKRVHQIAKERGLPAKDVLARLRAAGVNVKAASSSVDEEVATRVLSNGGEARAERPAPASESAKAPAPDTADQSRGRSADGPTSPGGAQAADGGRGQGSQAQAPAAE
ncbi:MAG TPA: translation initiation factor IF-2 N-terminal domain-containing protein, partial [Solirubrobacteraceae bacterium]|nr:translation initiation factor IF-2 N-terminal domain-containing protein [Solirubrobacteraceae bacterium]